MIVPERLEIGFRSDIITALLSTEAPPPVISIEKTDLLQVQRLSALFRHTNVMIPEQHFRFPGNTADARDPVAGVFTGSVIMKGIPS